MRVATPHYLLFSESCRKNSRGEWRFVLQSIDSDDQFEAADAEPDTHGERLELLAVVRGLEALQQPSRVTLVTPSKYVNRGLAYGLEEWRANDWQWEHFGQMVPVKNHDLWQRVDGALRYHQIDCRTWRFDLPHLVTGASASPAPAAHFAQRTKRIRRGRPGWRRKWIALQRWWGDHIPSLRLTSAQCGTRLLPLPWFQ